MKAKTALLVAAASAIVGLSSCASSHKIQADHWNLGSVPGRVTYNLTGYRGPQDGSALSYFASEMGDLGQTFARHFGNYNSENPNQGGTHYELHYAPKPPKVSKFKVANENAPQRVFD